MSSQDDSDEVESGQTGHPQRTPSFRERHALKILGAIMVVMLATVILVQVAC